FMLCRTVLLMSQESIDISYNYGSVLVHSPKIEPISNNPVSGFSVNYTLKNKHGEQWRKFYNYPSYGFSYTYKSYHDPDVLGDSHAINSFLQLSFLKKHRYFDIGIKGLAGIGYFTNIYDSIHNPTNQAISTKLNISAELRLYSRVRFEPFYLEYSYGLNHSSNGLIKSPNLGINVLNNSYTLGYEFEQQMDRDEFYPAEKPPFIKNEIWAFVSTGFKEIEYDNKRYTFTGLSFNYSKQISVINKMGFGADLSRDPSLTTIAEYTFGYSGTDDLSYRFGINVHNEFLIGSVGLYAAYGLYLGNSDYYISQRYYKAGFKFYFNNLFGVVLIRAIPLFQAEVIEFGLGFRITDKKYRNKNGN
ncbi:acyloxyacyl hydrolase, partial [Draconibacterium sp.]|nr:acyloxyacyl hydrolase [Draconibacterium sp.]